MIESVSDLLKEMDHSIYETKCYTYVLKEVSSKLVYKMYEKSYIAHS